ncbi:MAG: radical SAM protein [Bacillota bacterium]|nr:radical SAM protein [Bacillota bacterium]
MKALHFLVTYRCTRSCPHCFVWGSPDGPGRMTTVQVRAYLHACLSLGIREVHFEGGEPFLHYELLLDWIALATSMGIRAGAVTNGFWATGEEEARSRLGTLVRAGLSSLMISTDDYHGGDEDRRRALLAAETARGLGLSPTTAVTNRAQVMFRGRAADTLAPAETPQLAASLTRCPHEHLDRPDRVHIDALGHVHLCQGLTMGQAEDGKALCELLIGYRPGAHPIVAPLLRGGPFDLATSYGLPVAAGYADACHLCYLTRKALRTRFSAYLAPDHLYGCGNPGSM